MNAMPPDRFEEFRKAYERGRGALVWRHDIADLLTPVAAFLKAAHGKPFSFLLESVEGGTARGRYSVIGLEPDLIWRCENGVALLNRDARTDPGAFLPTGDPPLTSLRDLIAETQLDVPDGLPPMTGGLSGYLGYDMVRLMESLPATNADVLGDYAGGAGLSPLVDGRRACLCCSGIAFGGGGEGAGAAGAEADRRGGRADGAELQHGEGRIPGHG